MTDGKIFYLHIPRTGGNSIKHILTETYGSENCSHSKSLTDFDESWLEHSQVLMGHYNWPPSELIPSNSIFLTVVRDPVAQFVSLYRYTCLLGRNRIAKKTPKPIDGNFTLDDFPETFNVPVQFGVQLRFVESLPTPLDFMRKWRPPVVNLQSTYLAGLHYPDNDNKVLKISQREIFERAVENIERWDALVGTTDRLEDFVALCASRLDWKIQPVPHINKTEGAVELDNETIDELRATSAADFMLYDYCTKRFDRQFTALESIKDRSSVAPR